MKGVWNGWAVFGLLGAAWWGFVMTAQMVKEVPYHDAMNTMFLCFIIILLGMIGARNEGR